MVMPTPLSVKGKQWSVKEYATVTIYRHMYDLAPTTGRQNDPAGYLRVLETRLYNERKNLGG